jgi:polyferredoxin
MTCLKACPHRSVEFNLRPPAIELWTTHQPRAYEVALLFLLLGNVFLHRLPELRWEWGLNLDLQTFGPHALVALLALALPVLLPLGAYYLIPPCSTGTKVAFINLAYGYLPLVWAGNLAHYLRLGLGEAGTLLPLVARTFGGSGAAWPVLMAHPAVIAFLQGCVLLLGALWSMFITQKLGKQSFTRLLPQHLVILALAGLMGRLMVGY